MQTDLQVLLLIVAGVVSVFFIFKMVRYLRFKILKGRHAAYDHMVMESFENAQNFPSSSQSVSQSEDDPLLEHIEYASIPVDTGKTMMEEPVVNTDETHAPAAQMAMNKPRPEILALSLMPRSKKPFNGHLLQKTLLNMNYYYGKMNVFHCHENDDKIMPVLYSVASLVEPGSFDYANMVYQTYPGILFWLVVQDEAGAAAFEKMFQDCQSLADKLDALVCDEKCQELTIQSIALIRSRVNQFENRQTSGSM